MESKSGAQTSVSNAITDPERFGKNVSSQILDHVRSLPINSVRDELVQRIKKNQVVLVKGKAGSGKSTQIPKYLVAAGYTTNGKAIAVVLPRRLTTKSLAERVALETGTGVGDHVGYTFRHDGSTSQNTIIKYLTDGQLNREATDDPKLSQYSVVMVDDAHEKSENTDLCIGTLKRICKERPEFRVVISSSSDDETELPTDFDNISIFKI